MTVVRDVDFKFLRGGALMRNITNRIRQYQNNNESAHLLQNLQKVFFTELP